MVAEEVIHADERVVIQLSKPGLEAASGPSSSLQSEATDAAKSGSLEDDPGPPWSWATFFRFAGPGLLMMTAFIVRGWCLAY